jgi:hypothetical protein
MVTFLMLFSFSHPSLDPLDLVVVHDVNRRALVLAELVIGARLLNGGRGVGAIFERKANTGVEVSRQASSNVVEHAFVGKRIRFKKEILRSSALFVERKVWNPISANR